MSVNGTQNYVECWSLMMLDCDSDSLLSYRSETFQYNGVLLFRQLEQFIAVSLRNCYNTIIL